MLKKQRQKVKPQDPAAHVWRFPCLDWEQRIEAGEMPINVDRILPQLNQSRVEKGLAIFNRLRCPDVPGQPRMEEAAPPWLKRIVELAAGGLAEDGRQRINTLGVLIPKKNSKTTGLAALTLTLAMMSPRPRGEILLLGAEQSIALLAYQQLAGMVQCDPVLRELWHVRDHIKKLEHRQSGVTISVKSFSMEAVTGTKPILTLLDEVHLLTHPDAERVLGQIRGGAASVPESQLIWLSTQADIPPRGLWAAELEKARNIRDGKLDLEGYLPILYEPPKKYSTDIVAASDPAMWQLVNPSLGYTVNMDWLVRSFKEAAAAGETETKRWLSQHANVQVSDFTTGEDAWGGAEVWSRGAYPGLTVEAILEMANESWGTVILGIDGGGLDDLLAVTLLYQDNNQIWWTVSRAFCYEVVMQRRQSIASILRDFEAAGDLVVMEESEGLKPVLDFILMVKARATILVAADPSGSMQEIASSLIGELSVDRQQIVAVPQGFKLKPGYQVLERRLRSGGLMHANQPVVNWCVSNAKQDPTSFLVTKKVSGAAKIDCLVSLATAAVAAMDQPAPIDVESMIAGFS